jgi:hypothetical protein
MATAISLFCPQDPPQVVVRKSGEESSEPRALLGDFRAQVLPVSYRLRSPARRPDIATILRAFAQIAERARSAEARVERVKREFRWIAQNRQLYRGRWVALLGDRLLATGNSAAEVYAVLPLLDQTPLVFRVESAETLPFGGW